MFVGGRGRWTVQGSEVSGSRVYISTSERTAGAVDSLVWGNKEYINNYDHGRQFQVKTILSGHSLFSET